MGPAASVLHACPLKPIVVPSPPGTVRAPCPGATLGSTMTLSPSGMMMATSRLLALP